MEPTARFAAVLRPWRARRGKGCARSSEIKFFLSLRTIERVRGERERERSQRPKLESELISWHAVHLVVYSSPALSLPLPLSPFLSRYNRLLFLVSRRFPALQSQNVAGLEHRWDIGTTRVPILRFSIFHVVPYAK